jgi:hypothetical protein
VSNILCNWGLCIWSQLAVVTTKGKKNNVAVETKNVDNLTVERLSGSVNALSDAIASAIAENFKIQIMRL